MKSKDQTKVPKAIIDRINKLKITIERHRHAYHTLDKPEISDEAYDSLFKELEAIEIKYPESLELNKNISSTSNTGNKVDGFLESNYAEYEPVAEAKNLFFSNGIFGSFIFILILAFINLIMLELIAFTILSAKRKRSKVKIRRYL